MKSPKNIRASIGNYISVNVFSGRSFGFVIFLTILAVFSIRAGHSVDEKVLEIARLEDKLKELEAEYLESKSDLMLLGLESQILDKGAKMGLQPSEKPPVKIVLTDE